jgi:hypothetical protein
MSDSQRRGFVPTRSLTGGGSGALRHKLYHTSANRSTPIFLGDAVSLSGGELIRSSTGSADSTNFVGIAMGLYDTNKKPLQGTGRIFLNTSVAGYVDVMDDPTAILTVECETCIDQSRVGAVAWLNVSANSQSSATGISKTCVNLTSAAGGNPLFRIVGLAPGEVAVTADGSLNNQVEVVAIDGIYRSH